MIIQLLKLKRSIKSLGNVKYMSFMLEEKIKYLSKNSEIWKIIKDILKKISILKSFIMKNIY